MRQKLSISRLLRNDKLMMLVSLIGAVVIWALVVYGDGNIEELPISGVPIPVALSEDVIETYDLYIVGVDKETATVKVSGTRGEIGRLSAQDIRLAVDTSGITKAGQYTRQFRVVSSGDYDVKIVGDNFVTFDCAEFYEKAFEVKVVKPHVTVANPKKYRPGTPAFADNSIVNGMVTVKGPKSDVQKIERIEAVIPDKVELTEPGDFEADLVAYDSKNKPVEGVQFLTSTVGKVMVSVPLEEYYQVALKPEFVNPPAAYAKNEAKYVTVSQSEIEFWCLPNKSDKIIDDIQKQMRYDFSLLKPENFSREIVLPEEGAEFINVDETITATLDLGKVSTKTITITGKNFEISNLPKGYTCTFEVSPSAKMLCGPEKLLLGIDEKTLKLTAKIEGEIKEGTQAITFKFVDKSGKIWMCYSNESDVPAEGIDIQVKIEKKS